MESDRLLVPFFDRPGDALIATDFDGTLAPIVDDPESARMVEGADAVLGDLVERFAEVAVISGRPLSFLEEHLPIDLTLVGNYGLETRRHGERLDKDGAGAWRETIVDVAEQARRHGPDGMEVENKGLSLTLHFRRHPQSATAVDEWARQVAQATGLQLRPAKMSVELHPPIDEDKGTVLSRLAGMHSGPVLFAGDDVGDLPAFDALDRLRDAGRPVLGVMADSPEGSDRVRERADLVLDGPAEVAALFRRLCYRPRLPHDRQLIREPVGRGPGLGGQAEPVGPDPPFVGRPVEGSLEGVAGLVDVER